MELKRPASSPAVLLTSSSAPQVKRCRPRHDDGGYPALPPGPKVLRELDRAGASAAPNPDDYLKRHSGKCLQQRVSHAAAAKALGRPGAWPPFQPGSQGINFPPSSDRSSRRPRTRFARMHDMGCFDFVAVRWGAVQNRVQWRRSPRSLPLPELLPLFLEGLAEVKEPYRFVAIHGSLDMVHSLGRGLAGIAGAVVQPLRLVLETRDPARVATGCLLLSEMLHHGGGAFGRALAPHFARFCQVLNLFLSNRIRVSLGYNTRVNVDLSDLVHHVLAQFHEAAQKDARRVLQRYTPLYETTPAKPAGRLAVAGVK